MSKFKLASKASKLSGLNYQSLLKKSINELNELINEKEKIKKTHDEIKNEIINMILDQLKNDKNKKLCKVVRILIVQFKT